MPPGVSGSADIGSGASRVHKTKPSGRGAPEATPIPPPVAPPTPGAEDDEEGAPSEGDGLKEQVKAAMRGFERELIIRALRQTQSNVTHAARLLKISRKGLQLKMKELGLRDGLSDKGD